MNERWRSLRNSFLAGLLVVGPLAASLLILLGLFTWITDFMLPPALRDKMLTPVYRLIVLAVFVGFTTLVGWGTRQILGQQLMALSETALGRVPLLNKMYAFIKEVSQTLLAGKKTVFQRVVLVPHSQPGMYSIGLVTSETTGEVRAKTSGAMINVFIPASPPMSGFLVIVPRDQVIELEMNVSEGMKILLSGGALPRATDLAQISETPRP